MMDGKRAFDLFWTVPGIILLSPLLLSIAIAIKWSDSGPALFRQERVGQGGHPFRIYKFRTMVVNAEQIGKLLTVGDRDPRITPIGFWLRRYKLDELPQLWNVLRGEMSLVGPRPEVSRYVALYDEEQKRVLALKPGITDPASIQYRNESEILAQCEDPEETYIQQIMPDKIRINLAYAQQATRRSDLQVILATLFGLPGDDPSPTRRP